MSAWLRPVATNHIVGIHIHKLDPLSLSVAVNEVAAQSVEVGNHQLRVQIVEIEEAGFEKLEASRLPSPYDFPAPVCCLRSSSACCRPCRSEGGDGARPVPAQAPVRFLVALPPVRDLLLSTKHLFASHGGYCPCWAIGRRGRSSCGAAVVDIDILHRGFIERPRGFALVSGAVVRSGRTITRSGKRRGRSWTRSVRCERGDVLAVALSSVHGVSTGAVQRRQLKLLKRVEDFAAARGKTALLASHPWHDRRGENSRRQEGGRACHLRATPLRTAIFRL